MNEFLPQDEFAAVEAELRLLGADLPEVPLVVRNRTLRTAVASYRSARMLQRVQTAMAVVLFMAAGLTVSSYYASLWRGADHRALMASAHDDWRQDIGFHTPAWGTLTARAGGQEWAMVDSLLASRERSRQILFSALWD